MNNFAFLLIICSAINTETGSVNYCGSRMCGHTDRHTFCKYQPGPGATCAGYIEAPLSSAEKENVLARLNRRRSDAAMGLDDWPPAGNMLKLMWVNELAREAQLWADQCIPPASVEEHDECRHLYSVTVGQCVASVVGEAPGLRPETMVDMWFMQRISYVGNLTSYMLSTTYQDFAQIVWSRAFLVGCARSRFMAEMRGRMRTVERLVCNFAPQGPALNRPLWALGEPASLCPSRAIPDKEYPALCVFHLIIEESGTDKKYLYIDYEFVETTNEQESQTSVTILAQDLPSHDENATENARNIESLANSYYLNDSLIDDKMIDDYLSDPDAYQRVQQELQRMETMLSTPSSTSASKVRRELRNYDQPTKYPDDAKTKQLLAEIERNKTIERGPMLNMVLKYVPLLKPYEKSILGSVEDNGVARLVPTTVLLVAVCL
ncbi:cysteine-rich secretory protein LCCL domain-containing 1-like isoform X2 [Leptidea sinapis]|uniref:cysteine-rich secretory protein LCCL domain-containing 1-like isoform X2 n=1 Tax=Leptidea sinapis TaxID=189913 RepID=UPI002125F761|nr:cysteine-rich secretory protein LCCL domain-containing 1-like isoform X2 [Leptidea sinapis]